MTKRFRKNELKFYLGCLPKEINKYLKDFPDCKEYVDLFLQNYTYNFVAKKWVKKDLLKNTIARLNNKF